MLDRVASVLTEAGRLLLDRRASGAFTFERKGVAVSASVDLEAHDFLLRALPGITPGVPVLSEEDAAARAGSRPDEYWLIDPLDGTASYVDGFSGFVTQAALIRACRPVLSGVYAPALALMYLAESGGGATCNGMRLAARARPAEQWILTDNYPEPRGFAADAMRDLGIGHYLECGSIGLKICRVADASADLFLKDVIVRDWDIAAPQLVLTEAGGTMSDVSGQPFPYTGAFERRGLLACANDSIATRVRGWLQKRDNP